MWYLLGKDEGHGFRKRRNADYQFYLTVLFLRQYLLTEWSGVERCCAVAVK